MSTKKIEGYAEPMPHHEGAYRISSCVRTPDSLPIVLLFTEDTVHTGAEVREMLREITAMVTGYYFDREEIADIAKKHGFTIDQLTPLT